MQLHFTSALSAYLGRLLNNKFIYEPEVFGLVEYLIKLNPGKIFFLDIGSNIGIYPLFSKALCKKYGYNIDCYAHEPLPSLYEVSKALQKENNLSYNLSDKALSNNIGTANFYISAVSDASNSLSDGYRPTTDVIEVAVSTLDNEYLNLLAKENYDYHLVLIDVETLEDKVLNGGLNVIKQYKPDIICEILIGCESKILDIMTPLGYHFFHYNGKVWAKTDSIVANSNYRDYLFVHSDNVHKYSTLSSVKKYLPPLGGYEPAPVVKLSVQSQNFIDNYQRNFSFDMDIPSVYELYVLSHQAYLNNDQQKFEFYQKLNYLLHSSLIPGAMVLDKTTVFASEGMGVVLHQNTVIGKHILIGTHVTVGGGHRKSKHGKRTPTIEDHVYIATGSKIIGGVLIGQLSVIGANSVVLDDVASFTVVSGAPAKAITHLDKENCIEYRGYFRGLRHLSDKEFIELFPQKSEIIAN